MAEQVARTIPARTPILATLPAGSVEGFDAYSAFGFNGATRLPGTPTSVRVTYGTVEVDGTEGRTALQRSAAQTGLDQTCRAGAGGQDCSTLQGSGLPVAANRVIAPNMRFTAK